MVRGRRWRCVWPRLETILLLLALLWTLGAKLGVLHRQQPDDVARTWIETGLADVAFIAAVVCVFALLRLFSAGPSVARVTLVGAAAVLTWSILNAAWLLATGVQLQPEVLGVLAQNPTEFWPVVANHLASRLIYSLAIAASAVIAGAWIGWRLVRPVPLAGSPGAAVRRASLAAAVLVIAVLAQWVNGRGRTVTYSGEALGFSSHWYGLVSALGRAEASGEIGEPARRLPRAGERHVVSPQTPREELPNVVVLLLESVSYEATSLSGGGRNTTPALARLAAEGCTIDSTRAVVPQTSKALWASLTGTLPAIQPDDVETVLVEEPYESLASLLAQRGYRSAFFQMSRGSFQCLPALCANLGFDWAWFRENLEDESAHLGYMSGDDFRMLDPIFEWVDGGESPFLLAAITSASHDPYELPASYEPNPESDRYQRYLRAIRYTDAFVAELCRRLEHRGLLDRTLLCILGDHGDAFRPESARTRWSPYEEIIRIPWLLRWPGHVEPRSYVRHPCSQLDVTPTILSLLGFEIDAADFDGINAVAPALDVDRRLYFSAWGRESPLGCVEGAHKFVYWPYTDTLFEYDLQRDPGEHAPRVVDGPEKAAIVEELLEWKHGSRFAFPPRRFRERLLYKHWRTFSSGNSAWTYYVH